MLLLVACAGRAEVNRARGSTANAVSMVIQAGHSSDVMFADYSEHFVVTAGNDRLVKLWSRDGRLVRNFSGHRGRVDGARLSADERVIVSWSSDDIIGEHEVRLWWADGSRSVILSDSGRAVGGALFDGDRVSAQIDKRIETWGVSDQRKLASQEGELEGANVPKAGALPALAASGVEDRVTSVAFHPTGDRFAVGDASGRVTLWSTETRLLRHFKSCVGPVLTLAFSPDGNFAAVSGDDKIIRVYTSNFDKVVSAIIAPDAISLAWSPGSDRLLVALAGTGTAKIFSRDGAELRTVDVPGKWVSSVAWGKKRIAIGQGSPYGDQIAIETESGAKRIAFSLGQDSGGALSLAFSPDGERLLSGDLSYKGKVWSLEGKLLAELRGHTFAVSSVAFGTDRIVTGSYDGEVRVWTAQGQPLRTLRGHSDIVSSIAMSGSLILSGSNDTTARLWRDADSLAFTSNAEGWIVYDDRGYFDAAKFGARRLAAVQGTQAFGIDQFAVHGNRPDLLLSKLKLGTPELIQHYRQRYEQRLQKLGLNTSGAPNALDLPRATIERVVQSGKRVELSLQCSDAKHALVRYDLYVNDVPVESGTPAAKVTTSVELTSGDNLIELSCLSETGAESYRASTVVSFASPSRPRLFFVGFGVSKYEQADLRLDYAAKDVSDVAAAMSKLGFESVTLALYTDAAVTSDALAAAKRELMQASVDDVVVLFIAGHGLHDRDTSGAYYFLPAQVDLNALSRTALSYESMEDLLRGIAPRQKLFFIDTCESGELEDAVRVTALDHARARGLTRKTTAQQRRPYLLDRDRYVYGDLTRRTGAVVFSSSRGGEPSFESEALKNGFFSAALITGLQGSADADKSGQVSLDELRTYVTLAVAKLSQGLQNPTVDRDNLRLRVSFQTGAK